MLLDRRRADGAAPGTALHRHVDDRPARHGAIGQTLAGRGVALVDAPVTGSSPRAADGTLTIMAGGEAADFERALPVLEVLGETIVHVGPLGAGEA